MINKLENPITLKTNIKKVSQMKTMNIVCFGFGQVAKAFIKTLNNNNKYLK